jgi:hypothetical protein
MNAHVKIKAKSRLQNFIAQYNALTPRLVIDRTLPPSTYQPAYVAHRDVTFGRKAGAK